MMLKFDVYREGRKAADIDLSGAYLFGQDNIPVRADLAAANGQISCVKRIPGACGLAVLWDAAGAGKLMLGTTRLPEREKPYSLNVELARAQIMRITQKFEDWGLFDYADAQELNEQFEAVRKDFVSSLEAEGADSAALADKALAGGLMLGEKAALFHADIFLGRRKGSTSAARGGFGCMVDLFSTSEAYQELLREAVDFIHLPVPWKHLEPKERTYQYAQSDAWVNWAARRGKAVHAGPLLSFEPTQLPEWLYIWEHDYDALRDLVYEHIQRVVRRYERQVRAWSVVSGIHAHNSFNLSFEQLMELTRMSCLLVKKLSPNAQVLIDLAMPWGEYYARNQRTIPPLLYADMAVQSGVKFDGFGMQVYMGVPVDGYYVRDLMQVSSLLDEFVLLGKPLHITGCEVPSCLAADTWDAWGGKAPAAKGGHWHGPWSQELQAQWMEAFFRIAMSKPYVETICWRDLADFEGHYIPRGGLCRNDLQPKLAYKQLRALRSSLAAAPGGQSRTGKKA